MSKILFIIVKDCKDVLNNINKSYEEELILCNIALKA